MDTHSTLSDAQIHEILHQIRVSSLQQLNAHAASIVPPHTLPAAYLTSLDDAQRTLALRCILLAYYASRRRVVPREFQLRSAVAIIEGHDVLIDAGTGSGKTLCQILPNLVDPESISITVSPLKRLQALQCATIQDWGIRTASINEDTTKETEFWDAVERGDFKHLVVQPEQLGRHEGHLTRLGRLLEAKSFTSRIGRLHLDEAHFLFTAGLAHRGAPAFRPAFGSLNALRVRLPKNIPVSAASATLPPHIKSFLLRHLNFDPSRAVSLTLSANRPNIALATHQLVGSLSDFRNLDFLVPTPFKPIPKTIIFHNNRDECAAAAAHLRARLPPEHQSSNMIMHYHSLMSLEYQTAVFEDFKKPDGKCRLLHATEAASTGLDMPGILRIIDYGVPNNLVSAIQRAGRGGRGGERTIYLLMYEDWVLSVELPADEPNAPDCPIAEKLTKLSKKPERTGVDIVKFVRAQGCLRKVVADYLGDESPDGTHFHTFYMANSVLQRSLLLRPRHAATVAIPRMKTSTSISAHSSTDASSTRMQRATSLLRPNIALATHQLVGSLSDFRNLDFLVPTPFKPIPKTIIFHNNRDECAAAAAHLRARLPPEHQSSNMIMHYHSLMSLEYQTAVFEDFKKPDGKCRLLHATEAASTGLDMPGILRIIDYGVPNNLVSAIQRAGRGGRGGERTIYLLMYEDWVLSVELPADEPNAPDCPIAEKLTKLSKKPERTGVDIVKFVRAQGCLRKVVADYLGDESPDALSVAPSSACCDRSHPENEDLNLDKRTFFDGRFIYKDAEGDIFAGASDEDDRVKLNVKVSRPKRRRKPANRPVVERAPLEEKLRAWLHDAHANDVLASVRPPYLILSSLNITSIAKAPVGSIRVASDATSLLEKTDEWGEEWGAGVVAVILAFNIEAGSVVKGKGGKGSKGSSGTKQRKTAVLTEVSTNVAPRKSSRLATKEAVQGRKVWEDRGSSAEEESDGKYSDNGSESDSE
ncbi:P-loop containing nucleoside triphosphate hydrolase protein [Mycena kentingensis (nom. inval.)]|nr:P-loop containing nucleoside triphosphate hydrolase protein [Mycena kentingensis (nom. inval.)]